MKIWGFPLFRGIAFLKKQTGVLAVKASRSVSIEKR